jgi:hypothetical protein
MHALLEMVYIHLGGSVKWWQIGEALHTGSCLTFITTPEINPLKAKLNIICHSVALLGDHLIFNISRIKFKLDMMKSEISTYLTGIRTVHL